MSRNHLWIVELEKIAHRLWVWGGWVLNIHFGNDSIRCYITGARHKLVHNPTNRNWFYLDNVSSKRFTNYLWMWLSVETCPETLISPSSAPLWRWLSMCTEHLPYVIKILLLHLSALVNWIKEESVRPACKSHMPKLVHLLRYQLTVWIQTKSSWINLSLLA